MIYGSTHSLINELIIEYSKELKFMNDQKSFEDSLKEIENIVEELEKGDISLEESIDLYKKGMMTLKECNQKIDKVEKELQVLKIDDTKSRE